MKGKKGLKLRNNELKTEHRLLIFAIDLLPFFKFKFD